MAPKLRVTLAADIQEQASGVPSLLAQMPLIHVVAARLPCGDYCLGNALGVEGKTAADLSRSIVDGL